MDEFAEGLKRLSGRCAWSIGFARLYPQALGYPQLRAISGLFAGLVKLCAVPPFNPVAITL